MKETKHGYRGVATLLKFAECQGIIMAANVTDLKKLCRGFYLAEFDPTKAKRVRMSKDK